VSIPGVATRQYSLVNPPMERDRYVLGVGRAECSRGGSVYIHDRLAVGDPLEVGPPRTLFGLAEDAAEHVLIAGGIGITPLLSMIRWCEAHAQPWRLLYCVRSRARAAYAWELAGHGSRVTLHVDQENGGAPPDIGSYISTVPPSSHIYCCGPAKQMDAVAEAAARLGFPASALHFERFSAPGAPADATANRAFVAVLKRRGLRVAVPADRSLLDALEEVDAELPYSCREGLCRTCEVGVLEGVPDHRDFVLSDEERASNACILPCVSRALSGELVLDL